MKAQSSKMIEMPEIRFGFEDLDVWKRAINLADRVIELVEKLSTPKKHYRLIENLEAAAASVAVNIAEGKGRFSKKEFVQFLYIARGSLYETVTVLILFEKRKWISTEDFTALMSESKEIAGMLMGLIKSIGCGSFRTTLKCFDNG
jgi:four helix bundle protein